MNVLKPLLIWALRGLLALVVIIVGLGLWIGGRYWFSLPKISGETTLASAPGEVKILRDTNGIPHIYGESAEAVYFGMGFAQAQDRFFFMDLARRAIRGRLSELVGDLTLTVDAEARAMNWEAIIAAQRETLPENLRKALEAYAAGVNAALAKGPIAPEYALLFTRPAPWTIEDSLACGLGLVVDQVIGLREDFAAARLNNVLSPAQFAEFFPAYPEWAPLTLAPGSGVDANPTGIGPALPVAKAGPNPGSNAFAVSGARSASGKPLLAGDPHVGLGAPATFYLAHLKLPEGDVVGASLPGTPLIVMGRGPHAAWAITNGTIDALDIRKLSEGEAAASTERRETIRVRTLLGARQKEIIFRDSAHGPIAEPAWTRSAALFTGGNFAVKSAAADRANRPMEAMLALQFAKTGEDVRKAAQLMRAPALNLTIALDNGDIGFAVSGALPARDSAGLWIGDLPETERPFLVNPAAGFVLNANNRQTTNDKLTGPFSPWRAARINDLLAQNQRHDLESFAAIQRDVTPATTLRGLIALRSALPQSPAGKALLERLNAWDGAMAAERQEPLLYALFYRELAQALYGDELKTPQIASINEDFIDNVLAEGVSDAWCDDIGTPAAEDCPILLGMALDKAAAIAVPPELTWGEAHELRFTHPFLSRLPLLGKYYSVRQPVGGDADAPFATHFSVRGETKLDFHSDFGPGFRAIYDLGDLNRSRFMIAPGQSGHIRSPFYRNFAGKWAAGEGVEIRADLDPNAPPAGAKILVLSRK